MKHLSKSLFLLPLLVLFVACGKKNDLSAESALSAIIAKNDNIISFGHISPLQLLNKSGVQKLPKINLLVGAQIALWEKGIDLERPIYYAVEGLNVAQEITTYAVLNIKNKDSLNDVIAEMGYTLEKHADFMYYQENDVTFGYDDHILIMLVKTGDYDGKTLLAQTFETAKGDLSEGKVADILATEGDLVSGMSIERIFKQSNPLIGNLTEKQKNELSELTNDGYIQSALTFENGEMRWTSKNLYSDELKDRFYTEKGPISGVKNRLKGGNAWMGFALNIDMKKTNDFINEFAPNFFKEIAKNLSSEAKLLMLSLGDKALSKLLSGEFAVVKTGNATRTLDMTQNFSGFIGNGSDKSLLPMIMDIAAQKNNDFNDLTENVQFTNRPGYVAFKAKEDNDNRPVKLPAFATNFGKSSIYFFVDFQEMSKQINLPYDLQIVGLFDYLFIDGTRDETIMVIKAKDPNKNILQQIADFYMKQFTSAQNDLAY
ncbi:MAG: hypothetical protein KA734_00740 [Fluviicola sp.]|nr:hypothetical protein [Fluviicola sp.]